MRHWYSELLREGHALCGNLHQRIAALDHPLLRFDATDESHGNWYTQSLYSERLLVLKL